MSFCLLLIIKLFIFKQLFALFPLRIFPAWLISLTVVIWWDFNLLRNPILLYQGHVRRLWQSIITEAICEKVFRVPVTGTLGKLGLLPKMNKGIWGISLNSKALTFSLHFWALFLNLQISHCFLFRCSTMIYYMYYLDVMQLHRGTLHN